ncbi:MAG: sulfur oxidation c-type cytochrome SoxA [Burkholderiales bacterium]|nr:sulfur oxidation c-type cytochrome SoxA [Burkholderiales bacterium]
MNRSRLAAVLATFCLLAPLAQAGPEEDRAAFLATFARKLPGVAVDDYVYGSLLDNADARSHYEDIMAFPPFLPDVERGRDLWEKPFRNGGTYADCLPDSGRMIAGKYPQYDPVEDRVITFEMLLNRCRAAAGEPEYGYGDRATMGLLTAYARSLSDGMPMQIRVEGPGALAKYEAGRRLFFRRIGQMNFACATCHLHNAGGVMRMETISPAIGQAAHFPVFRGGETVYTLHMRYIRCMEQVRAQPFPAGSEAFNDLEYFHSYLSNGLPLQASVYRR